MGEGRGEGALKPSPAAQFLLPSSVATGTHLHSHCKSKDATPKAPAHSHPPKAPRNPDVHSLGAAHNCDSTGYRKLALFRFPRSPLDPDLHTRPFLRPCRTAADPGPWDR